MKMACKPGRLTVSRILCEAVHGHQGTSWRWAVTWGTVAKFAGSLKAVT